MLHFVALCMLCELFRLASRVVCATLAIPLTASRSQAEHILEQDDSVRDKQKRLATLLGLSNPPTRPSLVKDLVRILWISSFLLVNAWGYGWRIGRVDAFRSKGRRFKSCSSRHIGTLGKSFTRSCLWRCVMKFRHSICAVSGVPLRVTGQNGIGQNGSNFYRFQFNWIEFLFSNHKSQRSDKPKWV